MSQSIEPFVDKGEVLPPSAPYTPFDPNTPVPTGRFLLYTGMFYYPEQTNEDLVAHQPTLHGDWDILLTQDVALTATDREYGSWWSIVDKDTMCIVRKGFGDTPLLGQLRRTRDNLQHTFDISQS